MEQPHHNPRQAAPAGGGGGGSGLLAALTLLFVAFTNQSFEGLLFLLAFLAWGSYCLPAAARAAATAAPEQEQQAAGSAKSLWAAVSGLSALALLLQLATQLAFLLGAPGLTAPAVAATLRLLGFPRSDSAADALLVSWAFFGAIFVAAAHLVEGQFVQDMPSAPDQAWHLPPCNCCRWWCLRCWPCLHQRRRCRQLATAATSSSDARWRAQSYAPCAPTNRTGASSSSCLHGVAGRLWRWLQPC